MLEIVSARETPNRPLREVDIDVSDDFTSVMEANIHGTIRRSKMISLLKRAILSAILNSEYSTRFLISAWLHVQVNNLRCSLAFHRLPPAPNNNVYEHRVDEAGIKNVAAQVIPTKVRALTASNPTFSLDLLTRFVFSNVVPVDVAEASMRDKDPNCAPC